MGDRRVDLQRFRRDLLLLLRRHVLQRAHVMQPVDQFDHDDADIVGHRDKDLTMICRLIFLLVLKFQITDLGDPFHQHRDFLIEIRAHLLG